MQFKIGSLLILLIVGFIVKISFETAFAEKVPHHSPERIPASIDQNYRDYVTLNDRR
ncbi:MAG TPA: hypothetical protein VKY27_09935 [Bacteriovoracaceae bacterium]|nr:hypothetical protein [Bacteriovoracaceae bacterium]